MSSKSLSLFPSPKVVSDVDDNSEEEKLPDFPEAEEGDHLHLDPVIHHRDHHDTDTNVENIHHEHHTEGVDSELASDAV